MRTGHRTAKGVAGYDLTGLFVGSEGTLGVVTEAVVRLEPAPDPALTALAVFDSLDAAVAGIVALRRDPHRPCLLEIIDRTSVRAIQAFGDFGFPDDCAAVLLVQSDRPGHVADDVARYAALLESAGATDVAVADDAQESEALLAGRRVMSTAFEAMGGRLAEDVCVPIGRLARVRARHRGHRASAGRCSSRSAATRATATCTRRSSTPTTTPTAWPGRGRPSTTSSGSGSRSAARSPASTASARSRCRGSGSSSGDAELDAAAAAQGGLRPVRDHEPGQGLRAAARPVPTGSGAGEPPAPGAGIDPAAARAGLAWRMVHRSAGLASRPSSLCGGGVHARRRPASPA